MDRKNMRWLLLVAVVLLLWTTANCCAQSTTAQITGRVLDPSGAVIPAAVITVINEDTGVKLHSESNDLGYYTVPLLQPGAYRVTVQKPGFKPTTRTGIVLQVDQIARLDFVLEVGAVTETVEVAERTPLLAQESSSLGQVVDGSRILSIPLNGRSPFRLVQLTTNVFVVPSANGQFGDVPVNTMDDSIISINGGRAKTNEVLIDGIPSTTGFVNQMTTIPQVDSTREFKVQSNNLSAEWGRLGGGVINVSTKSGTNDFHGSAFEFLRNSAMDANEFFNKRAGSSIPPFRMNQFGFAVGGPVLIPRCYNGKERTFWFADYQGTRWRRGDVFIGSVPTSLQRSGDFTQTLTQRGERVIIFDPLSTRPDPARAGRFLRDPFPGDIIPSGRLDPVGRKLVSYYPAPNTAGDPLTGTQNYVSNASRRIDQAVYGSRVDHNVSASWRMFGRFSVNRTTLAQPDNYRNPATTGVGANGRLFLNNYTAGMDHSVIVNPTTVLNVRYGLARFFWSRRTRSFGFDQKELGLPGSLVSQMSAPLFPIIAVEGFSGMGGGSVLHTGQDTHSLLGSVTHLAGRHNFKSGVDVRLRRLNLFNLSNGGGNYTFNRVMTRGPDPNVFVETGGSGLASLLLGTASSGSINIAAGNSLQNFYYAAYVQDDIRVSRRLTLNLGVRWETESPYSERRNQMNWFDFNLPSPVRNATYPNLTGALVFATADARTVYHWDYNNVAPRAGFAYTLTSTTVLRGGAGLFYSPFGITNSDTGFVPGAGYSSTTPHLASLDGITPYRYISNPFPEGLVQPTRESLGSRTFLGQGISVWDRSAVTPYTWQWNFDIQQLLPWGLLVDAAYSASRGVRLNQNREFNALDPRFLVLGTGLQILIDNPFYPNISVGALAQARVQQRQLLLPYPQYTSVGLVNSSTGNSIYHSLALKVERRLASHLGFLVSYTAGKLISDVRNSISTYDNNLNTGLNPNVQNWYDLRAERSLSELDTAQSLAASFVADLPFGAGKPLLGGLRGAGRKLLEGWQLGGQLSYRSGYPLMVTAPIPGGGNRPNSVGRSARLPEGRSRSDQVNRWFDTSAFLLPPSFSMGNVSRTLPDVRGPSFQNIDVSLAKKIPITERIALQMRLESFNLANKPNFWQPNTALGSLQFGQINSTTGLPRVNQCAMKIVF